MKAGASCRGEVQERKMRKREACETVQRDQKIMEIDQPSLRKQARHVGVRCKREGRGRERRMRRKDEEEREGRGGMK